MLRLAERAKWIKALMGFGALRVGAIIGGLAVVVAVANLTSAEEAGLYFAFTASVLLVSSLLASPLQLLAIRFGSIARSNGDHGAYTTLILAGAAFVVASALLISALFTWLPAEWLSRLGVTSPWLFVVAIALACTLYFQIGLVRANGYAILSQIPDSLVRPFGLLLMLLLAPVTPWLGHIDLPRFFIVTLVVSNGLLLVVLARSSRLRAATDWRASAALYIRNYPPLALRGAAGSLLASLDVLLVASLAALTDIASYKVAAQVAMVMGSGIIFANVIYGPQMAVAYASQDKEALEAATKASSRMSFAIAGLTMLLMVPSPRALDFIFGPLGSASYPLMIILGCGRLVNAWFGSLTNLGAMTGNAMAVFWSQAIGVIVLAALSWLLAPQWGATGIAIASTTASITWNTLLAFILRKRLSIPVGAL